MIKLCNLQAHPNVTLGLNLSRAPWDPYPWVSGVQDGSIAYQAGVRTGDTILELNDCDILGEKISELAVKLNKHYERGRRVVKMLIWRNPNEKSILNQDALQKFPKFLQGIAQLLECPICLEIIKPPGRQCCNGHVTCNSCRGRSVKCPICRVALGPRGRCLLSDKLFALLAESFPSNGVKNANSLLKNYPNDCQETTLIKTQIDNSPPSPSSSSSSSTTSTSSPHPTLEQVHQRKQLTKNAILNYFRKRNNKNNNKNTHNKLAVGSKSRTPDDNKEASQEKQKHNIVVEEVDDDDDNVNNVVLKLNQKSKKKNDFADFNDDDDDVDDGKQYGSSSSDSSSTTAATSYQHQYHHQNHPSFSVLGQQELTFHCPTGKSSCFFDRPEPKLDPSTLDKHHHLDTGAKAKTLDSIWTDDIKRVSFHRSRRRRIPKGEEDAAVGANFETSGKFITKWDILSHLTQVHQISVAQHYSFFGQTVRLQLLQNFKSIPCITIQSGRNWTRDKENLMQAFMSSGMCSKEKVQGHKTTTTTALTQSENFVQHKSRNTRTELFFVACMPLDENEKLVDKEQARDEHKNENESRMADGKLKKEEGLHRNCMNDVVVVHADSEDEIPPSYDVVGITAGASRSPVVVGSPEASYTTTGVIKIEAKSKPTSRKGTHSQTTGHLILDPDPELDLVQSTTSSSQSRYVKHCPSNSHTCTTAATTTIAATAGYRNTALGVDSCSWCAFQSSSHSCSSTASCSSSSSTSSSSSSSLMASYSMSSSTSSHCCCSSPSDTGIVSRQHAIFIWYFGNECDVKNFQTVIECKRTGIRWTGPVHPLTKSWSFLQRQHLQNRQQRQRQQHMEQQFLVLDLMPDGGDNFFDILIETK